MQRESKQFQNEVVNESYLQIFSDMANKELQDGHYEEAIQLFLQTSFDRLHNNSKKYILDLILAKKYQEAIDYLEKITLDHIDENDHKEFILKNKKDKHYLPHTIGYRYALLKYYEQLNNSRQAIGVHQNLQSHLMQIASLERSIPISEETINYLFDLPTQIKINIEFKSVLPINTVNTIKDRYGEIVAEYFLDKNRELCFVAYRSTQFVLNFTESFPYHKLFMKGLSSNTSIKLTGIFYSELQAIATNGINDLVIQSDLAVRDKIIGPDCHLVIEKNVRIEVGNNNAVIGSEHIEYLNENMEAKMDDVIPSIQVSSISMGLNSKLRGKSNLLILAKSLTDLHGNIKAKNNLIMGTSESRIPAVYLQGENFIKAKKTHIFADKMMMVDKSLIIGSLSIDASESFIAENSTLITKNLECDQIILLSISEDDSINQDMLCELSITNGKVPVLIKHNNQFYLYRYYAQNQICFTKIKNASVDINKLNFSNNPVLIPVDYVPFHVMTAIKSLGGYARSQFTLKTPKAQLYGEVDHDVVSIVTDMITNHESSILYGEEATKIRTGYYTNQGTVGTNTDGGHLEIRFRGYCKNGITQLSDLYRIAKYQLPKTATHKAYSLKLVGPLCSEINVNRIATHYRKICIGNTKIVNHDDIKNENESQVFLLKLANLPNVSEIINDIKQLMSKVLKGDFNSFKSASNNITFDSAFNFLFFLVKRVLPAIGSLTNIAFLLGRLLLNCRDLKDNIIAFWNSTDDFDITEIIELLEPVIRSFSPAVALASQLSDSIDHGVIGGLSAIRDSDSVLVREAKEQQNLSILLACQNPVRDWTSVFGLACDVVALAAPASTHHSVFSAEFGSLVITGSKTDNSVYRVSGYNIDCSLNSIEYAGWSREANWEIVRNSSKTAYRLDLRDNSNCYGQNTSYSAPELILDASTNVDADSLSLTTHQLPIYRYLHSENEFKNIHARNHSAEVDSEIVLDRELTDPGTVSLTSRNKEGIVVRQRVKAESLSLRAPQGEVKIEADIESENDNSIDSGYDIEIKAANIQSGGATRLNANHDLILTDVDVKAESVFTHAGHDLTKTATHFYGKFEVKTTAGHDLNDRCRQNEVSNPLGGTKALWNDSTSISEQGSVTEQAGHLLYLDGHLISKTGTRVSGKEGVLITALIKEYIAAREHHSSWFGLVESDKTTISNQVHQPIITSEGGKTVIESEHGKGLLKGVLLFSPDGTVNACYQGIDNQPVLVSDVTYEESNILGGLLSHSDKTIVTERDVPTLLLTNGVSEFRAKTGGINLQSILIYGDGSVILNAPGQSVRLSAPILHKTSKLKQRGFHVSLELPLLNAIKQVVEDAKQAFPSGSVPEAVVNGLALGVDAVNTAAQALKAREALAAAHSLNELASAVPVSLRVGYGVEATEAHSENVGQGNLSVNKLEVTANSFNVVDGFIVDVGTLVLHTPEVSVTGAELTDTEQRQAIDVSVDLSPQGVQGGDVTTENENTQIIHHAHSQLRAGHALLDVNKFTCQNGDFKADDVEGKVEKVEVRSSQDTFQQTNEAVTVSTRGTGFDTSTADVAKTNYSHFNVKQGHHLAVGYVNLEGGTFNAPGARVGVLNETPVYDHTNIESFGLSVSFPAPSSHNDNPIDVPVRGHFQQGLHESARDSAGDRVLRDDEIGYNFVAPVVHAVNHQPQLPVPKSDERVETLPHNLSIPDIDVDPLTYDPEADLHAKLKSFNVDDQSKKPVSPLKTNSIPIVEAYAEVGEYLKQAMWGAGRAIQHAVASPIELLGDLEIIAYKKMFGNTSDNRLSRTVYADYYDLANSRMEARKSAFLQFGNVALDASVVGFYGASPWAMGSNKAPYQNALTRQEARLSGLLDYAGSLSAPELVGAASYQLTSFVLPGLPYVGLKAMDNYHRFGVATLPRFRNIRTDDLLPYPAHLVTPQQIRATTGKKEWIFTVTADGKMHFTPKYLETPVHYNGRDFEENHHPNTCNGNDVVLAGDSVTRDGHLIKANNYSGHYRPNGQKLYSVANRVFSQNGFPEINAIFETRNNRLSPAGARNTHHNMVPFYDSRMPIYVSGSTHAMFNSSNRLYESMNHDVQSLNDTTFSEDSASLQSEDRNNDESTYELMNASTKESFIKMLKSLGNDVRSFRHLRQCATAEMYMELADEALLSKDKFSTRVQKIEQTASRFIATSACARRAFTLFRSIPGVGQSPVSYAALPIIVAGSYVICGRSAEKTVLLACNNAVVSDFDDEAYQQTFMNI